MRAKAVLAPGLRIKFINESDKKDNEEWYYEDGLTAYLTSELQGEATVPEEPFVGHFKGSNEEVDWAVAWLVEEGEIVGDPPVSWRNVFVVDLEAKHRSVDSPRIAE